jgi:transposase-like protein/IS1 family transposase
MIPTTPAQDRYRQFSCPNLACARFNRPGEGNIAHRSWTGKHQQIQRLRCTVCTREFSEREGTLMARSKLPEETVERVLKCQRWGVCDAGTADICGVDIKTVHRFQHVAAQRAQAHHEQVTRNLRVEAVQLDEMHSKRRGPHVEWLHTALAMGSRFVLWGHWGPRTQESAALLVAQVVARLCGLPVWLSDGWKAYPAALLQVLGRVSQRRRRGTRGRHPKPRLLPPRDLFYGQVVKVRDGTGKLLHVVSRVVYGGPRRFVTEMACRGLRPSIHTAFMERWYGTLRGLCAPLRRRTRCSSSSQRRHQARVWLVVDLYNFVLPHKSLRQQGQPRTPAMAIGLAQHVWSDRDYIGYPVHADPLGRQLMQQRVKELLIPALEAG